MKKIILFLTGSVALTFANAIVINANTQSLYLGDNNVSCGRIPLSQGTRQSDVQSFCTVLDSSYQNGATWMTIQTTEFGSIDCEFTGGQLNECFKDD